MIRLTAEGWSRELQLAHRTIRQACLRAGLETGRGVKYSLKDIVAAYYGDAKAERARLTRAQADLAEHEMRLQTRETVRLEDAEAMIRSALQPVRESLLAAPSTLAARCNPVDPHIARLAVEAWVDETLRVCRERVGSTEPVAGEAEKVEKKRTKRGRPRKNTRAV